MRDFGSPYESMTPKILEKYSSYQFEYLSLAQILNKTHSVKLELFFNNLLCVVSII